MNLENFGVAIENRTFHQALNLSAWAGRDRWSTLQDQLRSARRWSKANGYFRGVRHGLLSRQTVKYRFDDPSRKVPLKSRRACR